MVLVLALLVHTPCGLTISRRTVVGGIALSLGLARRPLPALAAVEPEAVRQLFALVEGRRAQQWRLEERAQVDRLIEEVVALQAPWRREDLRGRWKLTYLQPGPDGGGVDRRNNMFKRPRSSRCSHPTLPRPARLLRAIPWARERGCPRVAERTAFDHPGEFPFPSCRGTTASRCLARTASPTWESFSARHSRCA